MADRRRSIDHFLPLSAPLLHTLLALADGDKHGYAIIKEILRRTDGEVRLSAGTLYTLLRRALADGLIVESDERRRYYRLAPLGRRVVQAEVARLEAVVEMARMKNLWPKRA